MTKAFTTKNGYLWVQPGGPNTPVYPLGCHDMDDIEESFGDTELLRCFDAEGNYKTVGEKVSPPDQITTTISALQFPERDWLDKIDCTFALYVMQRISGNAGVFTNYTRGTVLANCRKTKRTLTDFINHEEDNESMRAWELSAWPPLIDVTKLSIDRLTTAETQALNDVQSCNDVSCYDQTGSTVEKCKNIAAAADSAVGPATANVQVTNDYGATWAPLAVDPGAAGKNLMSLICFEIAAGVTRRVVAQEAAGGAQGLLYYSDDNGATWITVNIGGAAAGHGAAMSHALYAIDATHLWLASAVGYIYMSTDGGETWTARESGVIHAGAYNAVDFADTEYGFAVGINGVVAKSTDGGLTWKAATAVTGTPVLNCVEALDANRVWVGTATGKIFFSTDAGVTWTERTGWTGAGIGAVKDIMFINDFVGYMISNTAAPVGSVLRTVNGGQDWEKITTPTNSGLNAIWVCDENTAYAVGEPNTGTAVILRVHEV